MSSRFRRTVLVAALALGALLPARPAAAAYAPRLLVTPMDAATAAQASSTTPAATGGGVVVDLRAPATDDPTSRFSLHAPLGYRMLRPTVGQPVGTASGLAVDGTGAIVVLRGTVVGGAADAAAAACAPAGTAVLLLQLARPGALLRIPIVVAAPGAAVATIAAATLTGCIPSAESADAGGLRLVAATFGLGSTALRGPTVAGTYRWRALFTPLAAAETAAASVEAQSLVRSPARVTAAAKLVVQRTPVDVKVTRTIGGKPVTAVERHVLVTRFADFSGLALEGDAGLADAEVAVTGGTAAAALRSLTQAAPAADGSWAVRIRIDTAAPAVFLQAKVAVALRDLGAEACTPSFGATVACVGATAPALKLESPVVRLATGR